jgi:hypothetical protein
MEKKPTKQPQVPETFENKPIEETGGSSKEDPSREDGKRTPDKT